MPENSRAGEFTEALESFEKSGDAGALLALFADGCELLRPESAQSGGTTSARDFWDSYRAQFSELSTEFTHVQGTDELAALEWRTRGTLAAGRSLDYRGVSLLTYADDGKIGRFATYYDTAAFITPENEGQPST